MSLRDYFAAAAMQGLLVREQIEPRYHDMENGRETAGMVYARAAYAYADAMLKAQESHDA